MANPKPHRATWRHRRHGIPTDAELEQINATLKDAGQQVSRWTDYLLGEIHTTTDGAHGWPPATLEGFRAWINATTLDEAHALILAAIVARVADVVTEDDPPKG